MQTEASQEMDPFTRKRERDRVKQVLGCAEVPVQGASVVLSLAIRGVGVDTENTILTRPKDEQYAEYMRLTREYVQAGGKLGEDFTYQDRWLLGELDRLLYPDTVVG